MCQPRDARHIDPKSTGHGPPPPEKAQPTLYGDLSLSLIPMLLPNTASKRVGWDYAMLPRRSIEQSDG